MFIPFLAASCCSYRLCPVGRPLYQGRRPNLIVVRRDSDCNCLGTIRTVNAAAPGIAIVSPKP